MLSARVVSCDLRQPSGFEKAPLPAPFVKFTYTEPQQTAGQRLRMKQEKGRGAMSYLRSRLLDVAWTKERKGVTPMHDTEWKGHQNNGVGYGDYIDPQFLNWFEVVLTQSYFPIVGPQLTISWDDHIHGLHSLYQYMSTTRKPLLEGVASTAQFADVWTTWASFSAHRAAGEDPFYHAFITIPNEVPDTRQSFRPQVFALSLQADVLPAWLMKEPTGPEKAAVKDRLASNAGDKVNTRSTSGVTKRKHVSDASDPAPADANANRGKGKRKGKETPPKLPAAKKRKANDDDEDNEDDNEDHDEDHDNDADPAVPATQDDDNHPAKVVASHNRAGDDDDDDIIIVRWIKGGRQQSQQQKVYDAFVQRVNKDLESLPIDVVRVNMEFSEALVRGSIHHRGLF